MRADEYSDRKGEGMRITKVQRRLLDAGGAIMAESPDELAFQHTCLAQTCLPHRRPPDDVRRWQRDQGRAHLLIVAGEAWHEKEQRFVERSEERRVGKECRSR